MRAFVLVVAILMLLAPVTGAQPPLRIGVSLAQTGLYAVLGQNQLRGLGRPGSGMR